VAATIDGVEVEGTVKTLKRSDGHVWLMPHNPVYAPILDDEAAIFSRLTIVVGETHDDGEHDEGRDGILGREVLRLRVGFSRGSSKGCPASAPCTSGRLAMVPVMARR
jgi:hypothetical protein